MAGRIDPGALNAQINSWATPQAPKAPSVGAQPFKIGNTQYNNIDHFTAQFDKMPKAQKVALYNSLGSAASKNQLAKAIYDHLNSQGRSQAPKQENGWQKAGDFLKGAGGFIKDSTVGAVTGVGNLVSDAGTAGATVIRELTGQNAKLDNQFNAQRDSTQKTVSLLYQHMNQTSDPAAKARYQHAIQVITANQNGQNMSQRQIQQENQAATDPRKTLINAGNAALDIGTLGVGGAGVRAGKAAIEASLRTGAKSGLSLAAKQTGKSAAISVLKGAGAGGGISGSYAALNTARDPNAKFSDYVKSVLPATAVGAVVGAGASGLGQAFKHWQAGKAAAVQEARNSAPVSEDLTPEQVRSMTPQKVAIDGATDHGTQIGISTPKKTQIGVKDISRTDNVQVKTPSVMTPKEYQIEANKINASYEKATKYIHLMPPAQQKVMQEAIDKRHITMQEKLDEAFHNPQVSDTPSKVTKVSQSTTKAPKNVTTGGKPAGYVNSGADKLKTKATPKTTPTAAPKSFAPLDKTTQTKVSELKAKSDAQPVAAGKTRLYQTNDGASGKSDQYFKNPDHLSNYINGRADNATLSYKDVPSERVQSTPGKPTVFRINGESNATADGARVSGGATKAEIRAIQNELTDHFDEKATYNGLSYKTETAKAQKLAQEDPKKAMDIAMNRISGDNAVHEVAVAKAVEQKALREGDVETLRKLATSDRHTQTSEAAQRLGTEGYKTNEYDPVNNIRKVMQDRQAAAEKRIGNVKQAVAKETSKMKVKAPSKDDWNMFIESIKC